VNSGIDSHLPAGWRVTTFDALKQSGLYTFVGGPFGSNLTSRDYVDEPGVPVIRGANLNGKQSEFLDYDFVFVSDVKAQELRRNLAYPGDMVFTQRGTLGQVGIIPTDAAFSRYVVSQSQMKITVDPSKAHPRFLYYYYRSPLADAYLSQRILATGVPHINLGILKAFPVLLPPLPEQRCIATILDKADAIRRKRREAIALTEELLRSTFLEMFGDPVTNPRGWPVTTLERLTTGAMRSGLSPSTKGSFPGRVLTLSAITRGSFDSAHQKEAMFGSDMPVNKRVSAADLLICRGNGNLKLVGCGRFPNRNRPDLLFPDTIIGVPVDLRRVTKSYLEFAWNAPGVRRQVERKARTTNGTHKINHAALKSIELPLPSVSMQQRFEVFASRLATTRARWSTAHDDALFHSLVQRAFRGDL